MWGTAVESAAAHLLDKSACNGNSQRADRFTVVQIKPWSPSVDSKIAVKVILSLRRPMSYEDQGTNTCKHRK